MLLMCCWRSPAETLVTCYFKHDREAIAKQCHAAGNKQAHGDGEQIDGKHVQLGEQDRCSQGEEHYAEQGR